MKNMAIDAINIKSGGGIAHLLGVLNNMNTNEFGINSIHVWCSKEFMGKFINDKVVIHSPFWVNSFLFLRLIGQILLPLIIRKYKCNILFCPSSTLLFSWGCKVFTMSQNMLPFESVEAKRFGRFSHMNFKLKLIKIFQIRSFSISTGIIFLSAYAQKNILNKYNVLSNIKSSIIPHGLDKRFFKNQKIKFVNNEIKLLYVSNIMPYKHQINVMMAVSNLRKKGLRITCTFAGELFGSYGKKFRATKDTLDPNEEYLKYVGDVNYGSIHNLYSQYDIFIYASSCENLPNILLEAMASSIPIVSSNMGPMPEILEDSALYFDPLCIFSIEKALHELIANPSLQKILISKAMRLAQNYSWRTCSKSTLRFISESC